MFVKFIFYPTYQNQIGKSMSLISDFNTIYVPGFAAIQKREIELTIQAKKRTTNNNLISIIGDDGRHITIFAVSYTKLKKIIKDSFWILQNTNL